MKDVGIAQMGDAKRFLSPPTVTSNMGKTNGSHPLGDMDFSKSYETLALFKTGPYAGTSPAITCETYSAKFQLGQDLSPLFPYLNAVADCSCLLAKPVYIKFTFENRLCAFYPTEGAFTPINNMAEAMEFLPKLLDFIIDISERCQSIVPSHKTFKTSSAVDIYRLLPGSNCGICGFPTCMAFAASLSRQYSSIVNCPHLSKPLQEKVTFPIYDQQGNVAETVSFNIDTNNLQQKISSKEARIKDLQARLASFEKKRLTNIEAANSALPAPLTKREIQVLRLITCGATNKEISADLKISQHTAKSHVIHIFNKLGVNDRAQASAWGAMHGIL